MRAAQRLPSLSELEQLKARLEEAEETLEAIRTGVVDALIVQSEQGDQVFTLKDASEPYRLLVERMAEGALTLNPAGHVLYANQRFAEMVATPLEQVTGGSVATFVDAPQRERFLELLQRAVSEPVHREISLRRQDGGTIPALLALAPIKLGGDIISAIVSDLSERKRIELVAASERFARAILEQISDAVLVCDARGRVTHCSQAAKDLFGSGIVGSIIKDLRVDIFTSAAAEGDHIGSLAAVAVEAARGRVFRGLEVRLRSQADEVYLLVSGRPLHVDGVAGAGCILSFTDITERRRGEEHQNLLVAELDHRVKNTLATIQSIALRTLGAEPPAEALLGRIAALAQAHSALSQTEWTGVELRDLIRGLLAAYQNGAGRVQWEGPSVLLDSRSAQVLALSLNELGTNAAKYGALSTPEGRVSIRWQVVAGTSRRLVLNWEEAGGPRVSPPSRTGFGTELIQRSLTYEVGAEVDLHFPAEGVQCAVSMPLREPKFSQRAQFCQEEPPIFNGDTASDLLAGRLVLLAEDSHVIAEELRSAVEAAGAIAVGPVSSVREASALATRVDAAILDINLHGEMIFPVLAQLKARGVPVVLLTGYLGPRVLPEGLRDVPVVTKPAASEAVLQMLRLSLAAKTSDFDTQV